LSITSNKPLDASDVVDHDPNSFDVAKDEIRRVRKLAAEFLIANAMNKSDTTADYFAASVEVDDDDEDIAEIVDGLRSEIADGLPAPPLRDNRSKQATREAVYDQQDLSNFVRVKIHKTPEVRSLIYDAIKPIALFETFADEEIMQIIDVFRPASFRGGEVVVRGGDVGNDFYVIESGKLIERVGGDATKSRSYKRGVTIGEMSLVFGSPSAATITADDDVRVWILERSMYISVISSIRQEQYQEKLRFIQNCVVGDVLFTDRFDFNRIEDFAIAAKVDNFEEGDVILREGDQVEMFYVVRSGTIARYKTKGGGDEVRMGIVEESKVFGTTSFIRGVGCPYTYRATGKVKVFYLTRHDFESIMGSVKDAFDNNTAMPSVRNTLRREASRGTIFTSSSLQSYKCDLDDLVFYNVLGRGAFGHVRLVQSKKTKRLFALKAQSKDNICRKRQEKHILNEFEIAMQVEHKTLLRIHCAMQDKKFVYFLLDLLPGEFRIRVHISQVGSRRSHSQSICYIY
jgi:cAMP-dependent protein kinase regulator